MQRLHIFRPGRHVAADGRAIEFTAEDLSASAQAYDPAKHEAPLVVGHPAQDAPAYGWVGALTAAGDGLEATPRDVDAAFAELVRARRFAKISASFYLPDTPQNPAPGVYYLRHVGFLGAQPPAVKGLKPVAFADAEAGVVEFSDWAARENASLWRRLREWIIARFGLEAADQVAPEYAIQSLEPVLEAGSAGAPPAYSESTTAAEAAALQESVGCAARAETEGDVMSAEEKARLAALEAENATLKANAANFAEREAAIAAEEDKARRREIAEFVEGLVKAGRVLPREQAGLVAYMDFVGAGVRPSTGSGRTDEEGAPTVIEFTEGTEVKQLAPDAWLRGFLEGLPVRVDFSERAAAAAEGDAVSYAAPAGYTVDAAQLDLHRKAKAYQAAHPNSDYLAAVAAVSKGA